MAKSHTYHMFPFEDRPPHYFLDQILADPVLNIPEDLRNLINFSYQPKCLSFGFLLPERKLQII